MLFFLEDKVEMSNILNSLLVWFEATSGLQINLGKLKAYRIYNVNDWDDHLHTLGCKEGSLPDKYLGLPLVASFKQKKV